MIIATGRLSAGASSFPSVRIRKMRLKIVLVGERRVGKTSLIQRYLRNHFTHEYQGTLGGRVYPIDLEVHLNGSGDVALSHVAFFDLMGEHSVRQVFSEPFFYGTQGVLGVCDVERPETLYAIKDWFQVVTSIAGTVPLGVAFNKVDRTEAMAIGPTETAWLRTQFPLVPTFMTSALAGDGVEDAFGTIIERTVDNVLAGRKQGQAARILRQRILLFVVGRERGASKTDIFAIFKDVAPAVIMEELDNLVRLDLLFVEEAGTQFVRSEDLGGAAKYRATKRGEKVSESPRDDALTIEEVV